MIRIRARVPLFIALILAACQSTPAAPATPPPPTFTPAPTPTLTAEQMIGKPIKANTPLVYRLMADGRVRHIVDWATFLAYGYQPGSVTDVSWDVLSQYPLGMPLTRVITGHSDTRLYLLQHGKRFLVADPALLRAMDGFPLDVTQLPDDVLNSYPLDSGTFPAPARFPADRPAITAAAWIDNALWIADDGGAITRWDVAAGKWDAVPNPTGAVVTAFARQGTALYMGTSQGALWRFDLNSGTESIEAPRQIRKGDGGWITSLALVPVISNTEALWFADSSHYDVAGGAYRIGRGIVARHGQSEQVYHLLPDADGQYDPFRNASSLAIDPAGSILWVGTRFTGLVRYDLNARTSQVFSMFTGPLVDNAIRQIALDATGTPWLLAASGVSRFQDGTFAHFSTGNDLANQGASAFAITASDPIALWVAGESYVARVDTSGGVTNYSAVDHPYFLDHFDEVVLDDKGQPWFVGRNRVLHFDGKTWIAVENGKNVQQAFTPGQPSRDGNLPDKFPSPIQDYASWVRTWPRPASDNGRCLHYTQFPTGESFEVRQHIARLQRLGARWTLVNYTSRTQLLQMAPLFAEAGITVVWRPFVRPYEEYPHWAEDVAFLRSLGLPPYMQVYNEPSLGQEWNEAPADQQLYLKHLLPALREVYDAGGYVGLQHIELDWLRATLQAIKAAKMHDIYDRLFFVPHMYGYNHPPDYDIDIFSVLGFREFARIFQEEIGFVPIMIGGEGGWRPGEQQDQTFPAIDEALHRDYHVAVFDWFRTGTMSNGEPLPDYLFAFCPWLLSDASDPAAWFDSASGDRLLTIVAVEAMPPFERRFAGPQ